MGVDFYIVQSQSYAYTLITFYTIATQLTFCNGISHIHCTQTHYHTIIHTICTKSI